MYRLRRLQTGCGMYIFPARGICVESEEAKRFHLDNRPSRQYAFVSEHLCNIRETIFIYKNGFVINGDGLKAVQTVVMSSLLFNQFVL